MKKDNYKINSDFKPLSSDQIGKHADFDKLLEQFKNNPLEKASSESNTPVVKMEPTQRPGRPWLYPLLAAVAAALVGVMMMVLNPAPPDKVTSEEAQAYFASQPFINPPIKTLKPDYDKSSLNVNQGGTFSYENGSTVIVPPAAFVNGQGNLVEGAVEIHYREFHDYVDFFVSGIPMDYDSAGTRYQLESAGMVEIFATQNGERLRMNPGKSIEVKLVHDIYATDDDPLDFNIYRLDTEQRNWVYEGKNKLEILPAENTGILSATEQATQNYEKQLEKIAEEEKVELKKIEATIARPVAPVPPVKANNTAHVFNLEFTDDMIEAGNAGNDLDEQRAALRNLQKQYKNMLWQVAPDQPDFNENAASNINWVDVKIRQLNQNDYELTLIGTGNQMKVTVNPVLTGADYQQAMVDFNRSFAQYETDLADRQAKLDTAREAILTDIADRKRMAKMNFEKRYETLKAEGKNNKASEELIKHRVVNTFTATNLGIWNCDRPLPPWLVRLEADFKNDQKEAFNSNVAFLADQTNNTVARFYAKKGTEVQYNQNSKKLLWVVTKDNKLAVYRPEQFDDIENRQRSHTFVLDVVDKKIESEEDVREILQF